MKLKSKKTTRLVICLLVFIVICSVLVVLMGLFGKKTKHVGGDGGSMYPTLSWCDSEGGIENCAEIANTQNRRVVPELILKDKDFEPEQGMIVEVKHEGENYGKRIVGLPGDTLLINDGYLYVNGEKLNEQYLWKPGMTYGQDFLQQCKETVVPSGKMVILGDNRALSHDSRDFGFVDISDVTAYLPLDMQNDINQLWGTFPTPSVMAESERESFITEVNKLREENGLSSISLDSKLNGTAEGIAQEKVEQLDFSAEPTATSKKHIDALNLTGYGSNFRTFRVVTLFGAYDLETYKYILTFNERFRSNMLNPDLVTVGFGVYKGKAETGSCSAGVTTVLMGLK